MTVVIAQPSSRWALRSRCRGQPTQSAGVRVSYRRHLSATHRLLSFTPVRIPDVCCVSRRYLKSQGVAVPCSGVGQLSPLVQLAALCVCQFLLPKRLALEVACLFNSGRSPRLFPCLEKWQHPGTRAAVSECSASALQDSWCRCKNKRRRKKTVCFC